MISQTTNASGSNPSLITAGLPSDSIMTSRLIHPSMTIKQNHQLYQNRATDSQHTILSHRTISDTYLNLSRKDINDVMTALHTLAQCVQDDIESKNMSIDDDDESSHHLTMFYSKNSNPILKNSSQANSSSHYPRYSIRNKRHSLSSDRCLNHHHAIKRMYLYPVEDFRHDLYDMKRKKDFRHKYFNHHNPSSYPSYTSNAILYTSTCESTIQPREIYHYSRQRQSTLKTPSEDQYHQSIKNNLSSSIPLSSYILDKLVYINQKEPISSIQILPQQAQTLQILQNNHMHSFMSIDSLNTKDISQKRHRDQTFSMGDQLNLNKIDVATQWSLQITKPNSSKSENTIIEMDIPKSDSSPQNQEEQEIHSIILTDLSQSITTIATNNSTVNIPLLPKIQSFVNNSSSLNDPLNIKLNTDLNEMCLEKSSVIINDEHELTKTETERFLTTLNIPTCKCSPMKLRTTNTSLKHSSIDENITYISLENDSSTSSSSSSKKKRTNQISIKLASKRPRRRISKSSKHNQTIKRSRPRRPQSIIPSYKSRDSKEDSSFDFFDIDTTFSDAYDRLFTDTTTTSEKSS